MLFTPARWDSEAGDVRADAQTLLKALAVYFPAVLIISSSYHMLHHMWLRTNRISASYCPIFPFQTRIKPPAVSFSFFQVLYVFSSGKLHINRRRNEIKLDQKVTPALSLKTLVLEDFWQYRAQPKLVAAEAFETRGLGREMSGSVPEFRCAAHQSVEPRKRKQG